MKKDKNRTRAEKSVDPRHEGTPPAKQDPRFGSAPAKAPAVRTPSGRAAAIAQSGFQWWHYALAVLASIMLAFYAYGPALRGEFLFDDSYLPFLVPGVAEAPLSAWLGVRPVLMISYWLNYQSSALNPYPYHVVNVFLHALNAVLAWIIVRRYLVWVNKDNALNGLLAIFAGLLFLLHPVQTESVAYVASRSEAMSVFFFLAALALYITRPTDTIRWGRAIPVIILFGIACTIKEHTVVLPVLLVLTDYYFTTPFKIEGVRRNWRLYVPIAVIGAIGLAAVVKVLQSATTAGFRVKEFTWYQYLFTQFRSIWLYLRLYVFPVEQNGDYDMQVSRTIFEGGAIFGLVGLLGLAGLAWKYRREYPLASFGFFGFLLLLAPTSSVVPIRDLATERRLYLPFICLLLITVDFLRRWPYSRTAFIGLTAAVSLAAGVATYQRSKVWNNALAFWQDTVEKSPHNSRAWFQLAYAQWQAGQCQQAVGNYAKVAELKPANNELLIDWAFALECAGKSEEAIAKMRQAAPSAHTMASIGMFHAKKGRAQEALDALAEAEKLDARFDMTYVYRGNVLLTQGNAPAAIAEYNRALAINPRNDTAKQALAIAQQGNRTRTQ